MVNNVVRERVRDPGAQAAQAVQAAKRPTNCGSGLVNKRIAFSIQFLWKKLQNLKIKLDTVFRTLYKCINKRKKPNPPRGGDGKPRVYSKMKR
jgi:hypothetical protein